MSDCIDNVNKEPLTIEMVSYIKNKVDQVLRGSIKEMMEHHIEHQYKQLEAMGKTLANMNTRFNGLEERFNKANVQATFTQPMFDRAQENINRMDMAIDSISSEVEDLKQIFEDSNRELSELQMSFTSTRGLVNNLINEIKAISKSSHELDSVRIHAIEMNAKMRAIANIANND